jgi:TPR repeat protein/WD40 repeat protein
MDGTKLLDFTMLTRMKNFCKEQKMKTLVFIHLSLFIVIVLQGKAIAADNQMNTLEDTSGSTSQILPEFQEKQRSDGGADNVAAEANQPVSWKAENKIRQPIGEILCLKGHTDSVNGVAFSPDGKCAISASSDETIRLWDVKTGKEIRQFGMGGGGVNSAVFFPDGKQVLAGHSDGTLRIWDVATGKEVHQFGGPGTCVEAIALSPNGRYAVSGRLHCPNIEFWDVENGKKLQDYCLGKSAISKFNALANSVEPSSLDKNYGISHVAFSPDGLKVAAALERTPHGRELERGSPDGAAHIILEFFGGKPEYRRRSEVQHWINGPVVCICFSPDSQQLLFSGLGWIRVLDLTSEQKDTPPNKSKIRVFSGGHSEPSTQRPGYYSVYRVSGLAFSPDGRLAFSGGYDNKVRLWDVKTGTELKQFSGHTEPVKSVAFSPNGRLAISGSEDKTVRLWRLPDKEAIGDTILAKSSHYDNKGEATQNQRHRTGLTSSKKDKEVTEVIRKAEQGDAEAQYELGRMYYIGPLNYKERESEDYREHEEDYRKEAIKWWTNAAEQGHVKAQCNLGAIYYQGLGIVTKDYEESSKWYRKAAKQGDVEAQYNLGEHYEYGYGVVKDFNEAYKWYKKAAEKGHVDAEYRLGVIYCKGQGISQDYKGAIQWLRKAAEKGHGKAQYDLAAHYYEGKGAAQDYNEAAKWYRRAANVRQVLIPSNALGVFCYVDEEDPEACYRLGQMYRCGKGVVKDNNEAFKWFKKAAERGHKEAQFDIGNMHCKGEGVKQDYIEAYKWYILSSNQGCTEAIQAKDKIKNELTPGSIYEAEKRAISFKIAKNKYNSPEYFFNVRPSEIKMRTYRELTYEDIAEAKRKGFSLPAIPTFEPSKFEFPKISTFEPPKIEIPKIPTFEPPKFEVPKMEPHKIPQIVPYFWHPRSPRTQYPKRVPRDTTPQPDEPFKRDDAIKLLPEFKRELIGMNPVRVRNPNNFSVTTGIRSGERGKNLVVPPNGVRTIYVPNGRYDIYFVYSNKPRALFQGDSFTLNNNGLEIQIVKVVNGNYNIRQVR